MCTGTCCRHRFQLARKKAAAKSPVIHQGAMFTHSILMQRNAYAGLLRRVQATGVTLTQFDWEPRTEDGVDGLIVLYEVQGTQAQIDQFKTFDWDKVSDTEE